MKQGRVPVSEKIKTCLWFATEAEDAAKLYTSLVPHSKIDSVQRSPADNPGTKAGAVLVVEFTLGGRAFMGLNGGQDTQQSNKVSTCVMCDDQAETDKIWDALLADGGKPQACGWLIDRWGHTWQITPKRLVELMADPDPARAKRVMESMMTMIKIDIAALEKAAGTN
jgi:predicted 3-demethylubiquinone-9 3-methyltransferase (glyoxalase superfamily)